MNQSAVPFSIEIKRTVLAVAFLSFAFVSNSLAETAKLPDTGQTICYDAEGNIIPCPTPGQPLAQDGSYSFNPLSYTDNGDGTVTDNNTGLIWQKENDGQVYNWYEATGRYDAQYNPNSKDVCGELTIGGHTAWRLPTNRELISLVNYSVPEPDPAIDSVFITIGDLNYWSSTESAEIPTHAIPVLFNGGSNANLYHKGTHISVRCVRGESAPAPSFADNADGTVTDNITGLVWQQGESGNMSWEKALNYCEALNLGNKTDWRLPNIKELESITDYTRYDPAIDTAFFPETYLSSYWSSTTMTTYPDIAWAIGFEAGGVGNGAKGANPCVRCVRGGQVTPPPVLSFSNPTTVPKNKRCDYGSKTCAVIGRYHTGIDYSGNGTAVAVAYGTVVNIEEMSSTDHGMGNNVIVRHELPDGSTIFSTYSHLASIDPGITENEDVGKGQTIGVLGCSGKGNPYYWCPNPKKRTPHLHFEMKVAEVTGNPTGVGNQNSTCKTDAKNADMNTCWGYVGSKLIPDDYGYINPNLYLP